MGLNFKKRPVREQLGINNDFIARGLADENYQFAHMDEHVILEFTDGILDNVDNTRRKLFAELRSDAYYD